MSRRKLLVSLALPMSGCAVPLPPEARKAVKRIGLVRLTTPDKPVIAPAATAGAGAAFGLAGLVIMGAIDAARAASSMERAAAAMKGRNPAFNALWLSQVETGLRAKGYEVIRVDAPLPFNEFRQPDFHSIEGPFDAVLVTSMRVGFSEGFVYTTDVDNRQVTSTVGTPVGLVTADMFLTAPGKATLLNARYDYGMKPDPRVFGPSPTDHVDPRFVLPRFDDFYDNVDLAFEGMREGVIKLSARLVASI